MGPRQLTCANCGAPANVPFTPRRNRPVYCSACHEVRSARSAHTQQRRAPEPRQMTHTGPTDQHPLPPLPPRRGLGAAGSYD